VEGKLGRKKGKQQRKSNKEGSGKGSMPELQPDGESHLRNPMKRTFYVLSGSR
jgi:hypothetical protein